MRRLAEFTVEDTKYFFGIDTELMALVFDKDDINHRGWIQLLEIGDAHDNYNGIPTETRDEFYALVNKSLEIRHGKVDAEFDTPLDELLYRIANNFEIADNRVVVKE